MVGGLGGLGGLGGGVGDTGKRDRISEPAFIKTNLAMLELKLLIFAKKQ